TVIRQGAIIDRAILDKEVIVGPGAVVGDGPDGPPNRQEPGRLNTGITVVGKRASIPRGQRIGRNVRVDGDARAADFSSRHIRSGDSVLHPVVPGSPLTGKAGAATVRAGSPRAR
ncbi:MAG: hypothetical protein ACHQXL_03885, partial [Candidatus Limnocylindrales bacterium]